MFNQGGPATGEARKCCPRADRKKFHELENQIELVETRLAEASGPAELSKLQTMLDKLEAILARLHETDVDDAD